MITESMLRKLWPHGDSKVSGLIAGIANAAPRVFAKYGFTSDVEIAQAMAQFSHECGAGLEMTENVHYTAQRASEVWPHRFESANDCYNKVGSWPGDPDFSGKLIDSVYGSRMGNKPGTHDGRNYIGRGLAQTTGRDGYSALGFTTELPLLDKPDLVNLPANALECGVADFVNCGCLPFAKRDDTLEVTKHLNGGTIGLEERKAWLTRWKSALQGSPAVPVPAPAQVIIPKKTAAAGGVVIAGGAAAQQAHAAGFSPWIVALIIAGTIAAAALLWYVLHKRAANQGS